jgi:hypothetical protein
LIVDSLLLEDIHTRHPRWLSVLLAPSGPLHTSGLGFKRCTQRHGSREYPPTVLHTCLDLSLYLTLIDQQLRIYSVDGLWMERMASNLSRIPQTVPLLWTSSVGVSAHGLYWPYRRYIRLLDYEQR